MSHGNNAAGASDPLCGTNYAMKAMLGCGSMGLVIEAEHLALGVPVVVKLLHKELAARPDLVDRMRIEAQALSRLRSPHIVAVSDFSVTPQGQPFLVMERLHGATLAEELAARGAFTVQRALDVVRQVLAGLEVAHAAGFVHRDIKPANIFVCRPERPGAPQVVKILDFGIAKVLASATNGVAPLRFPTAEGDVVGTPRCLSPEQARARPVDARTDVYAVGLLLYALLTGAGPFDHITGAVQLFEAHANVVPPPPSERAPSPIPKQLDAAVMRALAKSPDDRFASAAMFGAVLAHIASELRGAPTAAKPTARRFGTEVAAPTAPGTPGPSPVFGANAAAPARPAAPAAPDAAPAAHAGAATRAAVLPPISAPAVVAPAPSLVQGTAPARAHPAALVAALCVLALVATAVLALLAARGWMVH